MVWVWSEGDGVIAGDGNDDVGGRGNTGMSSGETRDLVVLETCDVAGLEHWALCLCYVYLGVFNFDLITISFNPTIAILSTASPRQCPISQFCALAKCILL